MNYAQGLIIAKKRPLIVVDFAIREIEPALRKTARNTYACGKYPHQYDDYVIVAEIIGSGGDFLMVPPTYGDCNFEQKQELRQRPAVDHVNDPAIMNLINGAKNG